MDASLKHIALIPLLAAALVLGGCKSSSDSSPFDLAGEAGKRAAMGRQDGTKLNAPLGCAALETELKSLAAAEIATWFETYNNPPPAGPAIEVGDDAADGGDPGEAAGDSGDYTNNQVSGVDEADFVKTDGERLFVLGANALHRFNIPAPGSLAAAGRIDIEGSPAALLLVEDRLLVLSSIYAQQIDHGGDMAMPFMLPRITKATVIDWPDGGNPAVMAERYFDGFYLTARAVNGAAYTVLHGQLPNPVLDNLWTYLNDNDDAEAAQAAALEDLANLPLAQLLPRSYLRRAGGDLEAQPYTEDDCAGIRIPDDSNGRGLTSILAVRLDGDAGFDAQHVVANMPVVYVSPQHLFLAEAAQNWWWFWWNEQAENKLNLHAFTLGETGIDYLGSGRVNGAPINQFAMDEHNGVLRVATWTGAGAWWSAQGAIESRIHTLRIGTSALEPLGELGGIAPGEQLHAARFHGDMAYLVTFEIIDPLFTVDLSDPAQPRILGELKIPGFSTYLHPHEDGRLLAVGIGGNETGVTWDTVVSLFDVNDPAAPALLATHVFADDGGGWNWSEALYEHKAFQYQSGRRLLAVPLGASRVVNNVWTWTSSLELIAVGDTTLSHHGRVDHSAYFSSNDSAYANSAEIRRSFFIGDYIYAISGKAVSVHAVDNPDVTLADALIVEN